MRHLLLSVAIAIGTAGAGLAQSAGTRSGIEATIGAQIEAFKADDLVRAFSFASPGIRRLFGDPETFGTMVRQGYPMVWRPSGLRFLEVVESDGALWQRVEITDAAGRAHLMDYRMIETAGGWKIDAVRFLEAAAPSV